MLADGEVVGRIMKAAAAPVGQPWLWALAYGHHEDRTPIYGYAPTREAAMVAFAKSWRRQFSRLGAASESGPNGFPMGSHRLSRPRRKRP